MKWIGPSTIQAIEQAGRDGVGVIIDPIAFVSEHIETLVELDHDYAKVAAKAGVAPYLRAPALGVHPRFIEGLAALVEKALASPGVAPGASRCDAAQGRCPLKQAA
jgi:ferrochelatase